MACSDQYGVLKLRIIKNHTFLWAMEDNSIVQLKSFTTQYGQYHGYYTI